MNPVKDKLVDYAVYKDGGELIGTADITLPDIEYMTETFKGTGVAGEVDLLTLGQTSSMGLTINWRTINGDTTGLIVPKTHALSFYGAQQNYNAATGDIEIEQVKVITRCLPKKGALGKFEKAAGTDTSNEMEAVYLKVVVDDITRIEIDKMNYKFNIGGYDYLEAVRRALGKL